jgi:hypothetical protein
MFWQITILLMISKTPSIPKVSMFKQTFHSTMSKQKEVHITATKLSPNKVPTCGIGKLKMNN